jgi:hypothetical protein
MMNCEERHLVFHSSFIAHRSSFLASVLELLYNLAAADRVKLSDSLLDLLKD